MHFLRVDYTINVCVFDMVGILNTEKYDRFNYNEYNIDRAFFSILVFSVDPKSFTDVIYVHPPLLM